MLSSQRDLMKEIAAEWNYGSPLARWFHRQWGDSFFRIDAGGGILGAPSFDFTNAALGAGLAWDTSQFLTSGTLSIVSAIPEPSTIGFIGAFLAAGLFRRRRRS